MPSIHRPLSGDVLVFDIGEERERAADPAPIERSGRNARTLLKEGPLRVTLVVLGPGGELAEHQAPGPITVQVIEGRIRFSTANEEHELEPGQLLAAGVARSLLNGLRLASRQAPLTGMGTAALQNIRVRRQVREAAYGTAVQPEA